MRTLTTALVVVLLAGCTAPAAPSPSPTPSLVAVSPSPTPTPTPSPTPTPAPTPRWDGVPVVGATADEIAAQIVQSERAIRDSNVADPELAWRGHLQQLTYRRISARPELRDPVLAALPEDLKKTAIANLDATADLRAMVTPRTALPTTWRIVPPAPMDELARYYRDAEAEFGVPWPYLASIHLVETRMGRIRGTSTAGAQGPMQFLPSTWAAYGEGDINSDRDSIRAAARYLKANGAPTRMANALFRYNNSDRYVRAVTAYAEIMRAEPLAYRGYYSWQVYYLTTGGDVLLPVGYGS